jgi:hypothetical protein
MQLRDFYRAKTTTFIGQKEMIEAFITGALFGTVVPSFLAINLLISNIQKDEQIKMLETEIRCTDKILGVMKKKEF